MGFFNFGSGVLGFVNRGILLFLVVSVVFGFVNIGINLVGFF